VENGYLGVGVFAPDDMLAEGDVDQIVDEIKSHMVAVSQSE